MTLPLAAAVVYLHRRPSDGDAVTPLGHAGIPAHLIRRPGPWAVSDGGTSHALLARAKDGIGVVDQEPGEVAQLIVEAHD
jgi:hypothetical protein